MAHTIDMVVDRQVVRPGLRERLGESFAAALKHGDGLMTIATLDDEFEWHDRTFASRLVCVQCGSSLPALEPRLFSYSSPEGACSACDGLGRRHLPDWNQLVRDPSASLEGGALGAPGEGIPGDWVKAWAKKGIAVDRPAAEMSEEHRAALLADLEERMEACEDEELRGWLDDSLVERKCDECGGGRLGPAGRSVRIGGATLPELTAMPARDALTQVAAWTFPESMQAVARPLVAGVRSRLEFLSRTGLGYLELDRESWTLSGGEHQRTRLARCLGSALAGVCYVLDEPTAGLHARDARRLATPIADLCAAGNTLVVVEHDPATIRRSDWMVEIGPRAGTGGGEVTASGPTATVLAGESATAKWLRAKAVGVRKKRPPATDYLTVEGATHRNLKDVSVRIPLARRTTLTGVSGSGKTTLAMEVLAPALRHALGLAGPPPFPPRALKGHEKIKRLVIADQRPIGRSPRSTPATFAGILDGLRWVYAQTKEAKVRGWAPARFAPNAKGGACATCKGLGAQKLETDAFGAEYAPCPTCKGKRFNPATLAIRFKGLDISEALGLTIADAAEFFTNQPKVAPKLKVLAELGLGYLRLDQWATTLSGGEAQRLKLALELAKERPEPTLFLLDEPTTGLHGSDVADLLATLDRLCDAGHTVLAVEHQLDVIRTSDWVIDMGPEGGPEGGKAVIEGTPEEVQACAASLTGAALRGEFDLG
ncbi:MAG TPA: excinuclease ABC subunit UvrA, partial [Planctomycetia bacterium]|nr:excinuclease ABC subunit UvrA [Planctomycetia bacterium]